MFALREFSYRARTGHGNPGKSWNLKIPFSRHGKSWKLVHCLQGPGKSWNLFLDAFSYTHVSLKNLFDKDILIACTL